jgi:hypothetical protein
MSRREDKRARFVRIASKRTNQVLNELRKLGNCSNTRIYEYEEGDVRKIFRAIKKELDRVEQLFKTDGAQDFTL